MDDMDDKPGMFATWSHAGLAITGMIGFYLLMAWIIWG